MKKRGIPSYFHFIDSQIEVKNQTFLYIPENLIQSVTRLLNDLHVYIKPYTITKIQQV